MECECCHACSGCCHPHVLFYTSNICLLLGLIVCFSSIYFFVDGLYETRGIYPAGCYDSCMGYAFGSILIVVGGCVTIVSGGLFVNAYYRLRRQKRSSNNNEGDGQS